MEAVQKMSVPEAAEIQTSSPDKAVNRGESAEARERKRAAYEAATTMRECLGCQGQFRSEGIHNRLCSRCRSRR